jgi:hypothetical protein
MIGRQSSIQPRITRVLFDSLSYPRHTLVISTIHSHLRVFASSRLRIFAVVAKSETRFELILVAKTPRWIAKMDRQGVSPRPTSFRRWQVQSSSRSSDNSFRMKRSSSKGHHTHTHTRTHTSYRSLPMAFRRTLKLRDPAIAAIVVGSIALYPTMTAHAEAPAKEGV